jgi:iron(III) transport system substrate-binding protein
MKKTISILCSTLLIVSTFFGCNSSNKNIESDSKELVIYSGRKEPLFIPIVTKFEEKTGIKVTLQSGETPALANAILEEKNNPRADIFVAGDAGTLEKLNMENVLLPNSSKLIDSLDPKFKAGNGSWVSVSARARIIMYNTNLVSQKDLPKSMLDLTDPKWKGQIGIQLSSNESFIAQITAMRKVMGDAPTEKYLRDLKANDPLSLKSSTDIRNAVGNGELKLGMTNHYYYFLEKHEGSPVGIIYPDQDSMGTTINISGAGILKGAKNVKNAKLFIDFLLEKDTQKMFAELNYEMPVMEGVAVKEARPMSEIKSIDIKLEELGKELENTINLMEKVGLP